MPLDSIGLQVGDIVTRSDLALEYGGATQGGIVASNRSGMVFIFTDHSEGGQFGYVYDGFAQDGSVLYYTGAGQSGDQVEAGSNSPVLTHASKGRTLHAFVANGYVPGSQTKQQVYLGQFVLDPARPYERMPAIDRDGIALRTVIVFRLLPVSRIPDSLIDRVGLTDMSDLGGAQQVPVEINSKYFFETAARSEGLAVRRESRLVDDFVRSRSGHHFKRWAIKLPEERSPLLTDVYDVTDRVLYEAKSISNRTQLRMAVGQLFDYRRHVGVEGLQCAVLLPDRPSADLRDYLHSAGLGLAFREGDQFAFED